MTLGTAREARDIGKSGAIYEVGIFRFVQLCVLEVAADLNIGLKGTRLCVPAIDQAPFNTTRPFFFIPYHIHLLPHIFHRFYVALLEWGHKNTISSLAQAPSAG